MQAHRTRETVSQQCALFHPRDTKGEVRARWREGLERLEVLVPSPIDPAVIEAAERAHEDGKRLILATGVFDILHQEHEKFVEKAKAAGDVLIVGVESDTRVRAMKGAGRPINSAQERTAALEKLAAVDHSFVLPENFSKPIDHERLIATLRPDALAVSSHTKHLPAKQRILEQYGGTVEVVHEHNPDISTTKLLSAMLEEQ